MKYLLVADKIYEIIKISFYYMEVDAVQTDLMIKDVPENEVWDISEFEYYKVKLINNNGQAEVVDFNEWREEHKKR